MQHIPLDLFKVPLLPDPPSLVGRVLITGGTGSLGQMLVRRGVEERWPCEFTILSRDEVKQGLMRQQFPDCRYLLGDVRDRDALELACRGQDMVVHAAAYKQVPTAEVNAYEAVKTNVLGSCNVAMEAVRAKVRRVIGISTDKAASPINLYGKSKAVMEAVFQQADGWAPDTTQFNLTRYGNVLGSRGSIVPLFLQQRKAGKPLTVTDDRMCRFWLTLDQAVDLIIMSAYEPTRASILVPKLPSMSIIDLAGVLAPDAMTIDIGIRPGEKIHEHLIHRGESLHTQDLGVEGRGLFRVYPAAAGVRGTLPDGFEYRTDTARRLSNVEMMAMLDEARQRGVL